jgi:hypothetical protein
MLPLLLLLLLLLLLFRCGWNLSGGRTWDNSGCRSYYMAEWTVFSFLINAGVAAPQASVGLTNLGAFSCPGSLAARALSCNTAYREWLSVRLGGLLEVKTGIWDVCSAYVFWVS